MPLNLYYRPLDVRIDNIEWERFKTRPFFSQTTQQNIQNLRNKAGFARTTAIKNNHQKKFSHPPSQNPPKKTSQMAFKQPPPNQPTHSAAEISALRKWKPWSNASLSCKLISPRRMARGRLGVLCHKGFISRDGFNNFPFGCWQLKCFVEFSPGNVWGILYNPLWFCF